MLTTMPRIAATAASLSRRAFAGGLAATVLCASAHAPADVDARAREVPAGAGDIALLDALLAVEHATLLAYRRAAACSLLDPSLQDLAARHAADHRAHRDLYAATIRALGGEPRARPREREANEGGGWRSAAEALDFVASHERGGADACLRFVPALRDRQLAKIIARVAVDEAVHWTMLNAALGRKPPGAALAFGT